MKGGDSSDSQTSGLAIGCIIALILMIANVVLIIWEFLRSDNKVVPELESVSSNPARRNRFYNTIPGVTDEQFQHSRFLVHYNRTEQYPSNTTVIDSLIGLENVSSKNHPILQLIKNGNPPCNVLRAYSSNEMFGSTEFYSYVNKQLYDDNNETLKKLMPFIRRATKQINKHGPSQSIVVYRGMDLEQKQSDFFTTEKIFRFPGFTSTSSIKHVASEFGNMLFEIHIPAGCHQVKDIAKFSCFSYEKEWLFSPYSRFRVLAKEHDLIILESMDNMV